MYGSSFVFLLLVGLVAEQFLESTATQLSYHGLCELNTTAKEGEISVFFRNNHFSTMIKHKVSRKWTTCSTANATQGGDEHLWRVPGVNRFSVLPQGHLYLLVTDQGFLQEESMVWESLHNVEGDGNFCNSDFRLCHPPERTLAASSLPPSSQEQQRQIDQARTPADARLAGVPFQGFANSFYVDCVLFQDYLVAVSLQQQQEGPPGPLSDLELARQLQQEEYQQQQQQPQSGSAPTPQQVTQLGGHKFTSPT